MADPHKRLLIQARVLTNRLGHAMRPFKTSIRIMFPLYRSTCVFCGREAIVRPAPLLFEDRFSGAAMHEPCPGRVPKDRAEIKLRTPRKPVASKHDGV